MTSIAADPTELRSHSFCLLWHGLSDDFNAPVTTGAKAPDDDLGLHDGGVTGVARQHQHAGFRQPWPAVTGEVAIAEGDRAWWQQGVEHSRHSVITSTSGGPWDAAIAHALLAAPPLTLERRARLAALLFRPDVSAADAPYRHAS